MQFSCHFWRGKLSPAALLVFTTLYVDSDVKKEQKILETVWQESFHPTERDLVDTILHPSLPLSKIHCTKKEPQRNGFHWKIYRALPSQIYPFRCIQKTFRLQMKHPVSSRRLSGHWTHWHATEICMQASGTECSKGCLPRNGSCHGVSAQPTETFVPGLISGDSFQQTDFSPEKLIRVWPRTHSKSHVRFRTCQISNLLLGTRNVQRTC